MFKRVLALSLVFGTIAMSAFAGQTTFSLLANVACYHVNAQREFNEINPGLGIRVATTMGAAQNWEIGAEVGFYKNSYSENTRYGLVSVDYPIAQLSDTAELRVGAFVGLFEYPSAKPFAERMGMPTIGDFITVPGVTASVRFDSGHDVILKVVPASSKADAIISLQVGYRF